MDSFPKHPLEFFRQVLQDESLHIDVSPRFGADQPNHREVLREASEKSGAIEISRSHTVGLGGFARSAYGVGFDIERLERLSLPVVGRICTPEELRDAGTLWPSLWPAKEAAFKALQTFAQPKIVSELQIGNWVSHDSQFETCDLLNSANFQAGLGHGAIYRDSQFIFAVFGVR